MKYLLLSLSVLILSGCTVDNEEPPRMELHCYTYIEETTSELWVEDNDAFSKNKWVIFPRDADIIYCSAK